MLTSADVGAVVRRFPDAWQAELSDEPVTISTDPLSQLVVGLKVELPDNARPGRSHRIDLVHRRADSGQIVGGAAVLVRAIPAPINGEVERSR